MNLTYTHDQIMSLNKNEAESLMQLAIGRVFRMLDRENKEGDIEVFERCSSIAQSCSERLDILTIKEFFYDKSIHNHYNISSSILFGAG